MLESGSARGAAQLARADQPAVLARQADGPAAGGVDGLDDGLVDRARQDHLDDVDRVAIGYPQAVDELALDLQAVEQGANLRAAAMDDQRVDADLLQQRHVARERYRQVRVAHGMAAIFDDERLAGIAPHERQRFGQHAGLRQQLLRRPLPALAHGDGSCRDGPCGVTPRRRTAGTITETLGAGQAGKLGAQFGDTGAVAGAGG